MKSLYLNDDYDVFKYYYDKKPRLSNRKQGEETFTGEKRYVYNIKTGKDILYKYKYSSYYDLLKSEQEYDTPIYYDAYGDLVYCENEVSDYLLINKRLSQQESATKLRKYIVMYGIEIPKHIKLPFVRDKKFYADLQEGICKMQRIELLKIQNSTVAKTIKDLEDRGIDVDLYKVFKIFIKEEN